MTDQLGGIEGSSSDDPSPADDSVEDAASATTPSWWRSLRLRWRQHRRTRISRWDRPPAPHDWRFFVGTLGRALIVAGLMMFGFVAYQLWGTGIETARAQNRLEHRFEQVIAATEGGTAPATTGVPVADAGDDANDTTADTADSSTTDTVANATDTVANATDTTIAADATNAADTDTAPAVPEAEDLSDKAVDQDIPPIIPGEAFARLEIPKIGKQLYVVPGVSLSDLKNGPGHYPDTPLPGQLGNAAIAGHRTTYGAPFFDVDELTAGDELIVTMITGDRFVYVVTGLEIVGASDYQVVTTRDPDIAELTLTSCHPKYSARDRIIVHSVLDPEQSAQVGIAEFYDLEEPDADPVPGDDPTLEGGDESPVAGDADDANPGLVAAPATTDSTSDDGPATDPVAHDAAADVDAGGGTTTADVAEGTGSGTTTGLQARPSEADAFTDGWFDDSGAWLQIALWGLALTVIALLAYRLSKRLRHLAVGVVVGIAPFVVCLYFFYQNVNRLLPPGI